MPNQGSPTRWPAWMLVSSGAVVILTAAADPWTWMVMATTVVAMAWLALTYVGAWLQRVSRWTRRRGAGETADEPDARGDATAEGAERPEGGDAAEGTDVAERGLR